MDWDKKTLIAVVGPTAVGKTAVAIQLAMPYRTEIISADSRQIFNELTIGTAKPGKEELHLVKHHFINSHSIHKPYDAAQFGKDALELFYDLFQKLDYLVLCGGSGLYIKGVLEGFDDMPEIPEEIRNELILNYQHHGIQWLQRKMKAADPELYAQIDNNNPQRLMRALEVKIGTGLSITSFRTNTRIQHPFRIVKIGLELPRKELYERIDSRMDKMIEEGLFEEAESLYPFKDHNALQTVGYQEIFDFIEGKHDREEAIRLLKRNSRRYAKRQLTWFKRDEDIMWFSPYEIDSIIEWIESMGREKT
jgi:tRNA dimethylallyltransferase